MKTINSFSGDFEFLSNFYPCLISYELDLYPTIEHAFQAAKTFNTKDRYLIRNSITPGKAKKLGRKVSLRSDWNDVRIPIMTELILQKFTFFKDLENKLINTENSILIEGNHWGDTFWGVCNGIGENNLGKILMKVREQIK